MFNPSDIMNALSQISETGGADCERRCILHVEGLFKEAGIPTSIIAPDSDSPVLYAKIRSYAPRLSPLLLYARAGGTASWGNEPAAEALAEGRVRSLSPDGLKAGAAVFSSVLLNLRESRTRMPYDIILLLACGEGDAGGVKLVTGKHPKLFKDIKYALGEIGGFPLLIGPKKLYPIMIAEKRQAWLRVTAGRQKHSGPMSGLAKAIIRLERKRLPVRVSEPVSLMAEALGGALGELDEIMMSLMQKPLLTLPMQKLMGKEGRFFAPLMRNSVSVNLLRGGNDINVKPETAYFDADMRLVPGLSVGEGVSDVRAVIGSAYEIDVLRGGVMGRNLDMAMFEGLANALVKRDPDAAPIPYVNAVPTDARYLEELGIQSYGYAPMNLPVNGDMTSKSKSAIKQAREDALDFGVACLTYFLISRDSDSALNSSGV
ncbi:MAG: peptidase dimerization domain-containing protein [Clostridiales bacterium]|jgi:acetylornithine deacetylase/succinyl-diaminopimelate desuccinylase-like protein|nr:peptidase dimerization domain-containing protein [Clostridiales bacterium]